MEVAEAPVLDEEDVSVGDRELMTRLLAEDGEPVVQGIQEADEEGDWQEPLVIDQHNRCVSGKVQG
jgi:hypothetical protein